MPQSPNVANYHTRTRHGPVHVPLPSMKGHLFFDDGSGERHLGNAPYFAYRVRESGTRAAIVKLDEITNDNVLFIEQQPKGRLRFEPTNDVGPLIRFVGDVKMLSGELRVIDDEWSVIEVEFAVVSRGSPWTIVERDKS